MPSGIQRRRAHAREKSGSNYERRRAELIEAAARCFRTHGFGGTNFAEVATEIGLDRASLYYYVGGKQELFREVVQESFVRAVDDTEALLRSPAGGPERVRALVQRLIAACVDGYPFLSVYYQENVDHVASQDPEWAAEMRRLEERQARAVEQIVQAGLDDGTLRPAAPADVVARGILGFVLSTCRWYEPGGEGDDGAATAQALGTAYADLLLAGLAGTARAG